MLTRKPYLAILRALYRGEFLAVTQGTPEDNALLKEGIAALDTLSVRYTEADLADYEAERRNREEAA